MSDMVSELPLTLFIATKKLILPILHDLTIPIEICKTLCLRLFYDLDSKQSFHRIVFQTL